MSREVIVIYLATYLVAAAIELLCIYLFIKSSVVRPVSLAESVYTVNLITFPLTQILAAVLVYYFYDVRNVHYYSEVIPFGAEYFLLKWQFSKLVRNGALSKPVPKPTILISMVTANLVTFFLGIVIFEKLALFSEFY